MSSLDYAWSEVPDSSMLAPRFSVTDRAPEEDWGDYQIPRDSDSDADEGPAVTNLIPDAIRSNWYLFSQSKLPEGAFNDLLMAASSHERTFGGPMNLLSSKSLRGFLGLWEAVRDHSAEPVLSISPAGGVIAEWFSDPDNSLVVMSNRNGDLFYSLFDQGEPCEGIARFGRVRNLVVMFLARETNPFSWSDADEG